MKLETKEELITEDEFLQWKGKQKIQEGLKRLMQFCEKEGRYIII